MERKYGSIIGTQLSQNIFDFVCFHLGSKGEEEKVAIAWTAPESIVKCEYTFETEVFSVSQTVHEVLAHGVHPYQELGNMDIIQKYQQVGLALHRRRSTRCANVF